MLLGPSALAAIELAGLERPGGPGNNGTPQSLRTTDQIFNNAFTAIWGYANWGGARWAWPFFPPIGFIFVGWSGGFLSGDDEMNGGFIG